MTPDGTRGSAPTARSRTLGSHLVDTGPLLCFGGSTLLADLYDRHFVAEGRVAAAVRDELGVHANRHIPPGDPKRRGSAKTAAQRAQRRFAALLAAAIPAPPPHDRQLTTISAELRERSRRKNRSIGESVHTGEAESIVHASRAGNGFVTNDIDAGLVAYAHGCRPETVVDLSRRLVGLKAAPRPLLNELNRLAKIGIDVGDRPRNLLDLSPR